MTPLTKYFCTNGYTKSIGAVATMVAYSGSIPRPLS